MQVWYSCINVATAMIYIIVCKKESEEWHHGQSLVKLYLSWLCNRDDSMFVTVC